MHIIMLSGGSGKRLWPLSNEIRSKQFLRVLDNGHGGYESMVQRVYRQIKLEFIDARVVIATSGVQQEQILAELDDTVDIVLEPERRDTFPAIALSCAFLSLERHLPDNEPIVVLPVDVCADQTYFTAVGRIRDAVVSDAADLVLMGIEPSGPSEKFGYILPSVSHEGYAEVAGFEEKPRMERACELIARGAMWNGGVFGFKLGYLMGIARSHVEFSTFGDLRASYGSLRKISFDYEVAEQAASVAVVPYRGSWSDLGTWDALAEEIGQAGLGNSLIAGGDGETVVVNELDVPVVALGTHGLVVAASADGILVSDRRASAGLKTHVDRLAAAKPRFERMRWGTVRVVDRLEGDDADDAETRIITIDAKSSTLPTVHSQHTAVWVVLHGEGAAVVDAKEKPVRPGSVVVIPAGSVHSIRTETGLRLVETIIGEG